MKLIHSFTSLLIVMVLLNACKHSEPSPFAFEELQLPLNVFYDNDEATDVYTDEYLYALEEIGKINLLGVSTSSSVAPFNKYVDSSDYERMHIDRIEGIRYARETGFEKLPPAFKGPKGHLMEPESGLISDTEPFRSEASIELIAQTHQLPPDEFVFVLAGGPLTVIADAYLQDSSIINKIVIGWVGGNIDDTPDYNAWADPWATYICMKKFRMILIPFVLEQCPEVTRELIQEKLPDTPLSRWMHDKDHHVLSGSQKGHDVDVPPIIAVLFPEYVVNSFNASVSGWKETGYENIMYNIPSTRKDPKGNLLIIEERNGEVGTSLYWEIMQKGIEMVKTADRNE